MKLKRMAILGGVLGGLAALVAGATTSGTRRPDAAVSVTSPAIVQSGAELDAEIARLHERLRPTLTPAQPSRNLFRFSAASSSAVNHQAAAPTARDAAPAPVPAPAPSLSVIGIAEDAAGSGAPVRTAIVSSGGELFFVKEGERVTDRYRVARISAEAVEFVDTSDQSSLRLALK